MKIQIPFDEVFKLLEEAFPVTEIRTYEGQRTLLEHPNYRLHIERDAAGRAAGILASWDFGTFRFVEHIAVGATIRGGGIGKRMLTDYMHSGASPIVLEVEPPDEAMAERRIHFYERCGFHLNDFPYKQPPLRAGQPEIALNIMSYPHPLTEAEFLPYKRILYAEVYKK
ncbi:GNAT family N-acetyltransferase [Paenibacillus ferrarius]|uniref:GNAT family N-acetyltransferase n=1 Tax=Paenibacillus ferrarius TaxID=1469647 RepID=UPI003D265519